MELRATPSPRPYAALLTPAASTCAGRDAPLHVVVFSNQMGVDSNHVQC